MYIFLLFLFTGSCADTFSSVKRGLTGAKKNSADEFLVEKKDPLILPPDFENLPIPDEGIADIEEDSICTPSKYTVTRLAEGVNVVHTCIN